MKALSLTQPFATLVAAGAKRIETRSWTTSYRGPLLIHAAKGFPADAQHLTVLSRFYTALRDEPDPLPRGAIVAVAVLADVVRITAENQPPEPERSFGDYTPGRYAWHLADVRRLAEPIPARGALGLWEWRGELPEVVRW